MRESDEMSILSATTGAMRAVGAPVLAGLLLAASAGAVLAQDSANATAFGACEDVQDRTPAEGLTDAFDQGACFGRLQVLLSLGRYLPPELRFCPSESSSIAEGLTILIDYVADQAERRERSFLVVAVEAFQAAWPCEDGAAEE